MPKETFGGDDDEAPPPEEPQKPKLDHFVSAPDFNIRDVFWKIIDIYSEGGNPEAELKKVADDRFSLMRVGVGVLQNPNSYTHGLKPAEVIQYTLRMVIDAGWPDAFAEFLEEGKEGKGKAPQMVADSLKELCKDEKARETVVEYLRKMLRNRNAAESGLHFLAKLHNPEISEKLKRELIILSRGDIGANQMNAMDALSALRGEDVKKTLLSLLSHWDEEARFKAASLLLEMKDEEIAEAARKRLESETDEQVKELLEQLAG